MKLMWYAKMTNFERKASRIDRHECRRHAVDFLIEHDARKRVGSPSTISEVQRFTRGLPGGLSGNRFTEEILTSLLSSERYIAVVDAWVLAVLDNALQSELKVSELSILRVAGYELLTRPEIPTTVIVNEVNLLAKRFASRSSRLLHACINRMIETMQQFSERLNEGASDQTRLKVVRPSEGNDSLVGLLSDIPDVNTSDLFAVALLGMRARSSRLRKLWRSRNMS